MKVNTNIIYLIFLIYIILIFTFDENQIFNILFFYHKLLYNILKIN